MKKNILLFIVPLLFFMATDAHAQDEDFCCENQTNFYAKIFSGADFLGRTTINGNKSTYNTGYIVAGSVGYFWDYGLRLEAEYAYRRYSIDKIYFFTEGSSKNGHFQSSSYMANLLWDMPLSSWGCDFWNIEPFVGAGIGYDTQKMHASNSRVVFSQRWNHFSWQIMMGLSLPISCNAAVTLEYKYHGSNHFYDQSIGVGLAYKFGFLR